MYNTNSGVYIPTQEKKDETYDVQNRNRKKGRKRRNIKNNKKQERTKDGSTQGEYADLQARTPRGGGCIT